MKEVTRKMIKDYQIKKKGIDFMGYEFNNVNQLSFHHLILSKAQCIAKNIEANGYLEWNGAILTQDPVVTDSHSYLHCIERIDPERFKYITDLLIEENQKRALLYDCLVRMNECLKQFEKEYCSAKDGRGRPLIKESYVRRRTKY